MHGFIGIEKKDCVNHVQKRMRTALCNLLNKKVQGESLGNWRKLIQERITNYYGYALEFCYAILCYAMLGYALSFIFKFCVLRMPRCFYGSCDTEKSALWGHRPVFLFLCLPPSLRGHAVLSLGVRTAAPALSSELLLLVSSCDERPDLFSSFARSACLIALVVPVTLGIVLVGMISLFLYTLYLPALCLDLAHRHETLLS